MITRNFAWIDIETTGLNPEHGHILEIASIITDHNLNVIDVFDEVIKAPFFMRLFPKRYMDPFVYEMHTKNGLLDDCCDPDAISLREAEDQFCEFLAPHQDNKHNELYFVGNSIGALDLPFLRKHMPSVMSYAHYRSLDISGLRLGLEQIFNEVGSFYLRRETPSNHRALDDVYSSINQLYFYRKKVMLLQDALSRANSGAIS
jgi:oligoribonuclease